MNDDVSHPTHYNSDPSGVECIEIVRHRNFNIGNVFKYIWRSGLKNEGNTLDDLKRSEIKDLNKAVFYLVDEIHRLGGKCLIKTDYDER